MRTDRTGIRAILGAMICLTCLSLASRAPGESKKAAAATQSAGSREHAGFPRANTPRAGGTLGADPAAGMQNPTKAATSGSDSNTSLKPVVVTASSTGVSSTLFLPIVLDVTGRARYTSEFSLINRGTTEAAVQLTYTASRSFSGLGSGTVSISLAAGRQLVVDDAIGYLRVKGLAIPEGDQGGSLRVTFENLPSADAASATVRVTAPAENGRAGVSYLAPRIDALPWNSTSWLFGLRASAEDRTNVALANASTTSSLTLRLKLVNGDDKSQTFTFPDVTLEPGQWKQLNDVFAGTGFSQGYATVSALSGAGPYFAYAVINNNETNDGSFAPFEVELFVSEARLLPVVVETGPYTSEVVLTNTSPKDVSVELTYRESQSPDKGAGGTAAEVLASGQQKVISSILETLRRKVTGVGPQGGSYAGTLSVRFLSGGSVTTGYVGARTGSPAKSGTGRYGLFYGGVGTSSRARSAAWVYGLRQDTAVRANVAVSSSPENPGAISVYLEVYDGESGKLVGTTGKVSLSPGGWYQWPNLLPANGAKQGYVRVVNETATGTFTAYGVVNDGPAPGSQNGTDDGSFIPAAATVAEEPSITRGRATTVTTNLLACPGGRISGVGTIASTDGRVWTVPAPVNYTTAAKASDLYNDCTGTRPSDIGKVDLSAVPIVNVDSDGDVITGFIFTDNYFELYVNGTLVAVDPVPFTPFNSSVVRFRAKKPITYAVKLVDWEENLGLGSENNAGNPFHAGDGGFIASFSDGTVTDATWKAQTFYIAPLQDPALLELKSDGTRSTARASTSPTCGADCYGLHWEPPSGWFTKEFNDSGWPVASTYTETVVGVDNKPAYTNFVSSFAGAGARFIWSSNLVLDNLVLVRKTASTASATAADEPGVRFSGAGKD